MRILTILSGILLILTGLWCLVNLGVAFSGLAFVLGIVMMINGTIGIISFWTMRKRLESMSWALVEAMLSLILGGIVLSNQLATDLTIIMFFGMWLLFSGCNRIAGAITLKRKNNKAWGWTMSIGVISAIGGLYCFLNPILAGVALGLLLGITFLLQGINVLSLGISIPHLKRRRHSRQESVTEKEL